MVTIRHAGDGLTRLAATGLVLLGMILLAGCQHASMSIAAQPASTTDHIAPEHTHQITQREAVSAKEFLVASAHPLASNAAYAVLEKGGTAIDAMVTVQTVLGLVEPQSSGLGGGAFLLYYDARNQQLYSVDGRETAPLAAPDDLFIRPDQSPTHESARTTQSYMRQPAPELVYRSRSSDRLRTNRSRGWDFAQRSSIERRA